MRCTVHRSFEEVRNEIIRTNPATDDAPFKQLRTERDVRRYLRWIDSHRVGRLYGAIRRSLDKWANEAPNYWEKVGEKKVGVLSEVAPKRSIRIFDWGCGPGTATAVFMHNCSQFQFDLEYIVLNDLNKEVTSFAEGAIIKRMIKEDVCVRHLNCSLGKLSTKELNNIIGHVGRESINLHFMFFVVDVLDLDSLKNFSRVLRIVFMGGTNFAVFVNPTSRKHGGSNAVNFCKDFKEDPRWNMYKE